MKRVTIKIADGKTATVELGHTYGEWLGRFDDTNFWDFNFEDLVDEGTGFKDAQDMLDSLTKDYLL